MNKWVYEPQCCDGNCNQGRRCHKDAELRAQREDADEIYTGHRYADLVLLAVAIALVGVLAAFVLMIPAGPPLVVR
jgi:hypothetical protein